VKKREAVVVLKRRNGWSASQANAQARGIFTKRSFHQESGERRKPRELRVR
jgi:hypothetical protein